MSKMIGGRLDVSPNGMQRQSISIVPELCGEQPLHRRSNAIDDRAQILRLPLTWLLKVFQSCLNSPAPSMAQNDDEPCAESLRGELDAADLRRSDDVSRNANHKEIAQALVEDDLYGCA